LNTLAKVISKADIDSLIPTTFNQYHSQRRSQSAAFLCRGPTGRVVARG